MEIKITGANGYLGKLITNELENRGYKFSAISRELLYSSPQKLSNELAGSIAVINLAGAPVLRRWSKKNREVIYNSRVKTAQNIVSAVNLLPNELRPKRIITASAIGVYKSDKLHDENSVDFDPGFLGNLVRDWESVWKKLPENISMTIFRIAVVLGSKAVTVKMMALPFKLGIGGKIGNGKQPFPFIHEKDVSEAFLKALDNKLSPGIYNLAAPGQITNEDFTKAFASTLRRPALFRVPAFVLKAFYGEAAGLLTNSPAVIPAKLLEAGFEFKFPTIEAVLKDIL
ncbi:MAG: TIGR01777 family oxidoreductase [Prolixibacteraceae bacterium]|nr:TIGR01777 family oxidoreductase [Prolixibacteraceae bacterium]NLO01011.1 TIGR01777 family protein [Bacteroidales bacterium]